MFYSTDSAVKLYCLSGPDWQANKQTVPLGTTTCLQKIAIFR